MKSLFSKSLAATTALCALVLTTVIPMSAQRLGRGPSDNRGGGRPGARVQAEAYTDGNGAFLRWQSPTEANVLGYNVYRQGPGGVERVNESIVIGGGMGDFEEAKSGRSFSVFDSTGTYGSFYQIEVVTLDGRRMFSASTAAMPVIDLGPIAGNSSMEFLEAKSSARGEVDSSMPIIPRIVAAETAASLQAPSVDNQQWVAGQSAAKISVRQDGIYRVLKTDLQTAGFNVSGSAKYWRLFANGNEQAIRVAPDGSYFEFYGRAIDTRESDTRVYYLVTGTVKGKRMAPVSARSATAPSAAPSFSGTMVRKYRTSYTSTLLNGDAENYYGDLVSPTRRDFVVTLPSVDTTQSSISMTVRLQGAIATPHVVAVSLNGTSIGTMSGSNKDSFVKTFTVPMSAVRDGSNTVSLVSSAASNDFSFMDTLSFAYAKRFRAESNRLAFVTGANKRVSVEGFAQSAVTVYDVTAPESPQVVTNVAVQGSGATGYSASLTTSKQRSMYAVQDGSALTPASITLNTPSTLSSTSNQATFIIVSHKNFMTEANSWAAYRTAQGYTVKVVDIEDVFDEFSYGSMSTNGINSFFSFAEYNWVLNPNYVLLIGDATYDYRNYEGAPFANFVPTRLFDTQFEETGSDDALVDFNNDGLADIPIGRVPARTTAHVTQLLQKTTDFEATSSTALATRGALLAYDDINDPAYGTYFRDMSQRLQASLPSGTPSTLLYRYDSGGAQNKTALVNGLNSGKYIVNWSGHGSINIWASSGFFSGTEAGALTNGTNLTVFTMLTCLNGYFTSLRDDNLAEKLILASGGGAAATWASSGKTTADVQDQMATRFYNKLGGGTIPRLGDLIKDAKTVVVGGRDVKLSWVLLGDPLLKMR